MSRLEPAWTPQRIGDLCRLYMAGQRFEDLAPRIGVTKGAAVGKFNRLRKEGHALACQAADERSSTTEDRVASWMERFGGTLSQCADDLGVSYYAVRSAWNRVRAKLGAQAI